jgi:hypothetical protein
MQAVPPGDGDEFVESSVLDTVIPHGSSANIEEILGDPDCYGEDAGVSLLPTVKQRRLLFFGMLITLGACPNLISYSLIVMQTN